ncbi:MAG: hypothetical protein P1U75_05810 [Antarcticimicrobium sp.]|uniref:hypothetical protein n=1 Tax=Antarcticimicrobium sp. TaxID=2824147 RepID=UPI0026374BE2|nr:hypothetical protein [Antarcticimicrobium sp.]MDF1716173.1 hypothetical protein [Antarcticimicrobium sp.]
MGWLRQKRKSLEVWGLILILGSAGWQVFLEDVINNYAIQGQFYGIKEQLYVLWEALRSGDPIEFSQRNESYDRFWTAYQTGEGFNGLEWVSWVRFVIFGIGSIFLIAAKIFEPE